MWKLKDSRQAYSLSSARAIVALKIAGGFHCIAEEAAKDRPKDLTIAFLPGKSFKGMR